MLTALPRPLSFDSIDGVARFAIVGANETGALLECAPWMRPPPAGHRLILVGREGWLKAVRIQLTVEQVVDSHRVIIRWNTISASHRAEYLPQVLTHILQLRQRVAVGAGVLPPGSEVVWDAQRQQVRRVAGGSAAATNMGGAGRSKEEGYYASRRDLEQMRIRVTGDHPPILDVEEAKRKVKGLHPLYERPPSRGYYATGEEDFHMVMVTAVGSAQCVFEAPEWSAPALGVELRLGVPMDPLDDGLTWVPGKVAHVTPAPRKEGVEGARVSVEIQIDRFKGALPSEFSRLIAHFQQQHR